ncbi:TPA: prophage tail fiber N-terminal domain-containing protein, partial [Escherichia coli]|nr:prophage tail fiber N-terminal domain-containing protein [Escherichia coli]
MTVKISGVLKDGLGNAIPDCMIELKSLRTSSTVIAKTVATASPGETGSYALQVEPGDYAVTLHVEDYPPAHVGDIAVYTDSAPGTLNDFLGAPGVADLRPEALRRFEEMLAETRQNVEATSQSAEAAKKSETAAASSKNAAKTSETNSANSAKAAAASQTASATSATEAKKSETNAKASETAAKSSETNAKSSQTAAKTSETNAKASETVAVNSAKAAAASQSAAKASEDAAREYAEQTAEPYANIVPPLPDVWIPFNDSLDMITGYSPGYKKVKTGDDVVQVASDKQVKFTRASTATYIDKSGCLQTAAENEPRFEREGLLIEGTRTNYFLNSNTPSRWTKSGATEITEQTDPRGFVYGACTTLADRVGSTTPLNIIVNTANRIQVTEGDYVTASCRVNGKDSRCRIRFEQGSGDSVSYSAESLLDVGSMETELSGADKDLLTVNVSRDGEWLHYEAVYKVKVGQEYIGVHIQLSPPGGNGGFLSTSLLNVSTPQVEKGTAASSFIATGDAPTTRASDMVTIPVKNNLYSLPFTVLCEAHKNWSKTPNAAPRVFDTYQHQADAGIIMGFGSSGGYDGFPYCD